MTNRHVVTKQRAPSTKSVIANIETALKEEKTEAGKAQLEHALEYWKSRKKGEK